MAKKQDVMRIWAECFPGDSPQWRRMFFDSAYVDEEALTAADPVTGETVSSLLLLPYTISFNGATLGAAYIYGAGTLRRHRARGHMSRLVRSALAEAFDRGDSLCVLIPANDSLRNYYARFGFTTAFYRRAMRYTSVHQFKHHGDFVDISAAPASALYDAFSSLMGQRDYCLQHTREQFLTLMEDVRLSEVPFAVVAKEDSPDRPRAMVWGRIMDLSDELYVTELLAEDNDSAAAALTLLQQQAPDRPVTILSNPSDHAVGGNLIAGGMARVVNARAVLEAIAAVHPDLCLTVRITDPIIHDNNGTYRLHRGKVTSADSKDNVDLDVNPSVLTSILFSSAPIGDIMGLPSRRPHMSLMLD